MKTTSNILLALFAAATLGSLSASASAEGVYMQVDGGVAITPDVGVKLNTHTNLGTISGRLKTKTGYDFNYVLGYRTAESIALELETGYQENSFSAVSGYGAQLAVTGSASAVPVLLNFVWTPKLSESLSATFGAGAGASVITADIGLPGVGSLPSDTKVVFGGQAKTGLSYKISETVSADLTYRLRVSQGPNFSSGIEASKITSHLVTAGLSIKF